MNRKALASAILVAVTAVLATLQCMAWSGAMNADGISYLDLASRLARGDASAIANGYWSPLYPLALATLLTITGTPTTEVAASLLDAEMRVVLAFNVFVLACAAFAFARLLAALEGAEPSPAPRAVRLWRTAAGAALWLWCGIRMIGAVAVTPDALLAGMLFIVTTDLVALAAGAPATRSRAVRVAIALALGYWTKAVFFPLLFVGGVAYVCLAPRGVRRSQTAWLLLPMVAIAAPLVAVQSLSQGRLTFGETGRLNYRWYVAGEPRGAPRAESPEATRQREPRRTAVVQVTAAPRTTLYQGPVHGTFPYWSDPSRFEPDTPIAFSASAQWRVLRENAHWYRIVAGRFAMLALIALGAALARQRFGARRTAVMLPALSLVVLYALTHPEGRLAAAAIAVLLTLLLSPAGERRARVPSGRWTVVECTALALLALFAAGRTSNRVSLPPASADERLASPASDLARLGVPRGAGVGVIGTPYGQLWAHQAGLRIVVASDPGPEVAAFDEARLTAIAAESRLRGSPLAAIVWHGSIAAPVRCTLLLRGGWRLWLPPDGATTRGRGEPRCDPDA